MSKVRRTKPGSTTTRERAERIFARLCRKNVRPTEAACRKLGYTGSGATFCYWRKEWLIRTGIKMPEIDATEIIRKPLVDVTEAEVKATASELRANPMQPKIAAKLEQSRNGPPVDQRSDVQKAIDAYRQAKRRWKA